MKTRYYSILTGLALCILLGLAACGPIAPVSKIKLQPTVTVGSSFQGQPTIPATSTYQCGAWSSNNAPGPDSTILIYAKLTKNIQGVSGARASGVVHFRDGDASLGQQPVSDHGGYVTFTLPLQGRQPRLTPATVDISFSLAGKTIRCTSAFFTPV